MGCNFKSVFRSETRICDLYSPYLDYGFSVFIAFVMY
eukprot:COSAG02_NODE_67036_length_254_cov_0.593548_1_plen_36_part_10